MTVVRTGRCFAEPMNEHTMLKIPVRIGMPVGKLAIDIGYI